MCGRVRRAGVMKQTVCRSGPALGSRHRCQPRLAGRAGVPRHCHQRQPPALSRGPAARTRQRVSDFPGATHMASVASPLACPALRSTVPDGSLPACMHDASSRNAPTGRPCVVERPDMVGRCDLQADVARIGRVSLDGHRCVRWSRAHRVGTRSPSFRFAAREHDLPSGARAAKCRCASTGDLAMARCI